MMIRDFDCSCEDYPCCGHQHNIEDDAPEWCDRCGAHHPGSYDCDSDGLDDDDDPDTDDEDVIAMRPRVNAFGQRLRPGAPELPGDHWLEESYDDRYEERDEY